MRGDLQHVGVVVFLLALVPGIAGAQTAANVGVELADLTWVEAEEVLNAGSVVVIALGAGSKEHGPHLRLDNDFQMAEYLKRRVLAVADVVVAPTLSYHFYPSFLEYPGSTHLTFETSRDMVVDVVRSLAGYGPRKFYILNTGVSTLRPLRASAEVLAAEGRQPGQAGRPDPESRRTRYLLGVRSLGRRDPGQRGEGPDHRGSYGGRRPSGHRGQTGDHGRGDRGAEALARSLHLPL